MIDQNEHIADAVSLRVALTDLLDMGEWTDEGSDRLFVISLTRAGIETHEAMCASDHPGAALLAVAEAARAFVLSHIERDDVVSLYMALKEAVELWKR